MNRLIIIMVAIIFILGCSKDEPEDSEQVPSIIPAGNEKYLILDSDYIFDDDRLHTFNLQLPQSHLSEIDSDPAAEQYVEGMLIFEGDTISPVGIRYKGSIGAFVGCVSGSDWTNPTGRKTCTKLSMKVKINWEGREETFYGLKKLQFHSQNLDDSQMHERLGYWLFRQMGVPAPRSVHAKLMINGEYSGLYALTEQIDGRFSRYHFDDGKGNVYKEVWPLRMDGSPTSKSEFINALKTNEDENPTTALIQNFAQQLSLSSKEDVPGIIESFMDIEDIISFAVVDRMIRNDDGPFHWYCSAGGCGNHNYYWVEEPSLEKIHLIPWDLDNAFENIINNNNPVTPIKDEWGEISNNCQPFNYGAFNNKQWSATCDKLTAGWVSFSEEYEFHKSRFTAGPFSESSTSMMLDKWSYQIRQATIEASSLHSDALSITRWEASMASLKNNLNFARQK